MSRQTGSWSEESPVRDNGPELDTQHAHPARVYNYWLGGKDNISQEHLGARTAPEQRQYRHVTPIIRKQRFSLSGMCLVLIWALCPDFWAGVPDSGLTF